MEYLVTKTKLVDIHLTVLHDEKCADNPSKTDEIYSKFCTSTASTSTYLQFAITYEIS